MDSTPLARTVLEWRIWILVAFCSGLPAQENLETGGTGEGFPDRSRLSGDWGGLRSRLEECGLELELDYTLDVLANIAGGRRRATEVLGNADLLLTVDLERLADWEGGTIFLYGLGNHGGDPSDNIGDIQIADNIEAFDAWKLYEAWIEQAFWSDRLSFLAGLYDFNSEFDVIPAADMFLNSSHGVGAELGLSGRNGPSIFPTTSLGARLDVRPDERFYLRGTVLDGVPGDLDQPRGTQVQLRSEDGLLLAAEVGFLNLPRPEVRGRIRVQRETEQESGAIRPEEPGEGVDGKYALGVWGYTGTFEDFYRTDEGGAPEERPGTYGVYLLAEQRVYFEKDDPGQGLTLFTRFGIADDRVNIVDRYAGAGAVYHGLVPGRDHDRLGVAVAAAHLGDEFETANRLSGVDLDSWEIAIELTYQLKLAPWFLVQPDFQYVINPGGDPDLDDAVVAGARAIVSF